MAPLKVTLISQDFVPMKGGIASYLLGTYEKYLSQTEFEAIIPTEIYDKEVCERMPFSIFPTAFAPFEIGGAKRESCNRQMLARLNQTRPDVVLFGYLRSHPEVGIQYRELNPQSRFGIFTHAKELYLDPIATTTQSNGAHKGYTEQESRAYKEMLRDADYVFAVSTFTGNLLTRQGIRDDYILLPPVLRTDRQDEAISPRDQLGLLDDELVLLTVGRLIARKGHVRVLAAFPEVLDKFPNTKYVIVGDGPERHNLESTVSSLGLERVVQFAGAVPDSRIPSYYANSDAFVLPCGFIPPNDVEGFGIVFLEANSYRKPVIAGNSGGVPDAIVNGKTGILVDPESSTSLKSAIIELLANPEQRARMGAEGYRRVTADFSNTPEDSLISLFKEDISCPRTSRRTP
jgi:phosphatidylinositol alpha-1,6-mannosyltransferase